MRKFYAFILAVLMVLGLSAAVYADDGVPATYGGYQVVTVVAVTNFSNNAAVTDAYCPDATWRATGGGYFIEGTVRAKVVDNRDVDGGVNADSWHVTAFGDVGTSIPNTATLTTRVICTKLG